MAKSKSNTQKRMPESMQKSLSRRAFQARCCGEGRAIHSTEAPTRLSCSPLRLRSHLAYTTLTVQDWESHEDATNPRRKELRPPAAPDPSALYSHGRRMRPPH